MYKKLLLTFVGFLAFCVLSNMPYAHAQDNYVVNNVLVDVTANNAVEARELAFEAAQIKAYEKLLARFLPPAELETFETPPLDEISPLVRNFEVSDERLSSTRYTGTYSFTFKPHFIGYDDPTQSDIEQVSQPLDINERKTLLIPIVQRDGRNFIWSRGPHRDAWLNHFLSNTHFIIPEGGADDRVALRDDEGLDYDYGRLNHMIQKYGTQDAKIIITNPQSRMNGIPVAKITIYDVQPFGASFNEEFHIPIYSQETAQELFARVAKKSSLTLEKQRKADSADLEVVEVEDIRPIITGPQQILSAQLTFRSMREWVDLKSSIERTAGVNSVRVKSLSAQNAVIELLYQGNEMQLAQNLNKMRVDLRRPFNTLGNNYGRPPLYFISRIQ